jgi:hypothetical protein
MAEDGAVSELRCRRKHQPSMPFLHHLINFVVACVGAASYADELTATLESSQIAIVIALLQQTASESNVIHGQSATHTRAPAEPHRITSVDIYCSVGFRVGSRFQARPSRQNAADSILSPAAGDVDQRRPSQAHPKAQWSKGV